MEQFQKEDVPTTISDVNNKNDVALSVNQSILKLTVQEYLENNDSNIGQSENKNQNSLLKVHILCCTSCDFLTIDLQTLKSHYEREHSKTKEMILGELVIYECKYCRSVSTERQIIKEHIMILHENDQKLEKAKTSKEIKSINFKSRNRLVLSRNKLKRYMQRRRCKTELLLKTPSLDTNSLQTVQALDRDKTELEKQCVTQELNGFQSSYGTTVAVNENGPLDFSMKSSTKSVLVNSENGISMPHLNFSSVYSNVQSNTQNTNITNITNSLPNFSPTNPQMCVEAFKNILSQMNNRPQNTTPTQPLLPPTSAPYINGGLFPLPSQSTAIQMNPQQLLQNLLMATAAFQVSNNTQGTAPLNLPPHFMLNNINNTQENNNVNNNGKLDLENLLINLQQQQLNGANNANSTGPNRNSPIGVLNQTASSGNLLNNSNQSRPLKRAYPSPMKQANTKQSRMTNDLTVNNNIGVTIPTVAQNLSPRDLSDSSSPPKSNSSTSNQENNASANNIHPNTPQSLLYNRSFLDNSNNPSDYDLIATQDFNSNKPSSPNYTKHLISNNTNQMSPLNTSDKPQNTSDSGSNKPHRQNFTSQQNRILTDWFYNHTDKPYPSTDDTRIIAERTGLNYAQVKKWFANKRARSTNTKKTSSNTPLQRSSSFSLLNTTAQSLSPSSTVNSTNINQIHQPASNINTNCSQPINFADPPSLPVDFTIKSDESSTPQQQTAN